MSDVLHGFYLSALGAELQFAPQTAFSASMATHYCRMIMALEACQADTWRPQRSSVLPRDHFKLLHSPNGGKR
jgi:hypothetical protein